MMIRQCYWADVESILERLSDQHAAEYAKIGFPGPDFNEKLARFCARGDTMVLDFDGKPQAMLSIGPGGNGTWLAVTREFFDKGLPAIKAAKRHMQKCAAKYGTVAAYVASDHPQTVKWMRAIGFTYVGDAWGMKIFLYR